MQQCLLIHDRAVDDVTGDDAASGIHTRQVSDAVPACIIRSLWQRHFPNDDIGVDVKYLRSVCEVIFPKLDESSKLKSHLGTVLSKYDDKFEVRGRWTASGILCQQVGSGFVSSRTHVFETWMQT